MIRHVLVIYVVYDFLYPLSHCYILIFFSFLSLPEGDVSRNNPYVWEMGVCGGHGPRRILTLAIHGLPLHLIVSAQLNFLCRPVSY